MQGLGIIKDNVVYGNGYLELLKTIFHHPSICCIHIYFQNEMIYTTEFIINDLWLEFLSGCLVR